MFCNSSCLVAGRCKIDAQRGFMLFTGRVDPPSDWAKLRKARRLRVMFARPLPLCVSSLILEERPQHKPAQAGSFSAITAPSPPRYARASPATRLCALLAGAISCRRRATCCTERRERAARPRMNRRAAFAFSLAISSLVPDALMLLPRASSQQERLSFCLRQWPR